MELIGIQIAVTLVTISIILSGILLGIGRALGYKNVERFGIEELFQSVLNAAIVGAVVVIVETIKTISSSIVTATCSQGEVIAELECVLKATSFDVFVLFQETLKANSLIGYYQTMALDFGSFTIQPFTNLSGVINILSSQALTLNILMILINLNIQIVSFFSHNALALFFPLGLLFRAFFATRRIGGFLIGIAIGTYIFYPAFTLAFPMPNIENDMKIIENFNNNPFYATMPILDLNGNNAIAGKMDSMSARDNITISNTTYTADFSGDITLITQANANAISKILFYAVIAPLFSLIITIVFIKEIAQILGGEIQFKTEVV